MFVITEMFASHVYIGLEENDIIYNGLGNTCFIIGVNYSYLMRYCKIPAKVALDRSHLRQPYSLSRALFGVFGQNQGKIDSFSIYQFDIINLITNIVYFEYIAEQIINIEFYQLEQQTLLKTLSLFIITLMTSTVQFIIIVVSINQFKFDVYIILLNKTKKLLQIKNIISF
ncbi:Hypothetical_protein [Hexamita inflata]|uniref:Hypothetical_protein n=1 Tax=Hexamita inflata TaxID=28002 RepID=A0AA86TI52_9EUKA|nr:Hypothetical protein HINF_LOCUS4217 [Hexamita inflata]